MDISQQTQTMTGTTGPASAPRLAATHHRHILTLEQLAYLALFVLSVLTRLWLLGDRSLHHDETLHAFYSWKIYDGQGYIHDPLMHGPLLYYIGALMYFLFSDNDLTARLGFALFGSVLPVLPYLVRRILGSPAALIAAAYLVVSPVVLYIGRFARHDIYSVTFEMLMFVGIARYAVSRQSRWLYLAVASFGFMFVNQETSYLFVLIVGAPLALVILWHTFKPAIGVLAAMAVAVAACVFVLPGEPQIGSGGNVVRNPDTNAIETKEPGPIFDWPPLETADNTFALQIRNRADDYLGKSLFENLTEYLGKVLVFFYHPAIFTAMAVTLLGLVALIWLILIQPVAQGKTAWEAALARGNPVVETYHSLTKGWRWLIAIGLFVAIYLLFFTALFTNLIGSITGVVGSLLYWLAQHEVERGGQPMHYYGVILAVYEPLALVWAAFGLVLVAGRWVRYARIVRECRRLGKPVPLTDRGEADSPNEPHLYTVTFLAWWVIAALGIYSWAGEKMPWLSLHLVLPLTLLGAYAAQWAFVVLDGGKWKTRPYRILTISAVGIFATVAGLNYVVLNSLETINEKAGVSGFVIVLLVGVLFLMLLIAAGLNWGWKWAFVMLALCGSLLGAGYTIRSSYRLAYQSGDIPREMMIYTQTSPDVMRVMRRLEEASIRRTGGLDIPVIYDNETIWQWYLRDFPNATRTGPEMRGPPGDEVQVVFLLKSNFDNYPQNREYLADFRIHQFPLRWWLPEDSVYRLQRRGDWQTDPLEQVSLVARILRAPLDDQTLLDLWDFLLYRDTNAPLGSADFILAVRPGLADQLGPGIGAKLLMPTEEE